MNYILDFIQQGGVIAYVLVAMNFVGYSIIVWKIISLILFNRSIRKRLPSKILHRVVSHNTDHHIIMESIRTEIALAFSPLQKGMTTIENIASISPLLGLLGTVFGIQDNVENDVLLQLGRILKEKDHIRSQSADSANEDA